MSELIDTLLLWINQHPNWTGFLVFLIAFSESMAIIGVIVPGVILMFAAGALIGAGNAAFWPIFFWASCGAVAGDSLSYWLGRRFDQQLRGLWPFNKNPEILQKGEQFFSRHGALSIALGRFVGPIRAVIPLVAGMLQMKPSHFLLANISSALVWAAAYLLPGIVLGASLELAAEAASRLVILGLVFVSGGILLFWISKRAIAVSQQHSRQLTTYLLRQHHNRWFNEIAHALADPTHPETQGLLKFSLLLVCSIVLLLLILPIDAGYWQQHINLPFFQFLHSLRTPLADQFFTLLTMASDWMVTMPFQLLVFASLWLSKQKTLAWYWLAACGFAWLSEPILKYSLMIERPPNTVAGIGNWSMPSGHTLRAFVTFMFLAVVGSLCTRQNKRWLIYTPALLLSSGIAFSRLYLGVHWLSDVIVSILLASLWVSVLALALHRHKREKPYRKNIIWQSGLLFIVIFSIYSFFSFNQIQENYRCKTTLQQTTLEHWQQSLWQQLPHNRIDLAQSELQPIQIQFAGSVNSLSSTLKNTGWQAVGNFELKNSLKFLSPSLSISELPLTPHMHNGEHERWHWIKNLGDNKRLVLRLWDSHYRLLPDNNILYLATVSTQEARNRFNLLNYAITNNEFEPAKRQLLKDINSSQCCQLIEKDNVTLITTL